MLSATALVGCAPAGDDAAAAEITPTSGPQVSEPYARQLVLLQASTATTAPTQLAWGSDRKLYVAQERGGVLRFDYDERGGLLTGAQPASARNGLGIAFHDARMYLSSFDSIWRLSDDDGDGSWGEPGETDVALVTELPVGDHAVNQLAVSGDALYIGIGTRTISGLAGTLTGGSIDDFGGQGFWRGGDGRTVGEHAYGGTIATIADLRAVPSTTDAARVHLPLSNDAIQGDDSPYRAAAAGRRDALVIHSAGARNPFGLTVDIDGSVWFTSNFHRGDSAGDGSAGRNTPRDTLDDNFADDVHDQLFQAVAGADYGYNSDNWRGRAAPLDPTAPGYQRIHSLTFDNLYDPSRNPNGNHDQLHVPARPDGLGPHSSATGLAFFHSSRLPEQLRGRLFITRWNDVVEENDGGHRLVYADLVAVDPQTGDVTRVAHGFEHPIDVLWDGDDALLLADHGSGVIYHLSARRRLL